MPLHPRVATGGDRAAALLGQEISLSAIMESVEWVYLHIVYKIEYNETSAIFRLLIYN